MEICSLGNTLTSAKHPSTGGCISKINKPRDLKIPPAFLVPLITPMTKFHRKLRDEGVESTSD